MNITIENITTASTADLLAFYNVLAEKEVKRFSDRKTAERRVLALLAAREELAAAPAKEEKAEPTWNGEGCPFCGDKHDQTANGAEGTYSGDNQTFCHSCESAYDNATGRKCKVFSAEPSSVRSAAVAATWTDPQVAALRSARMKVMVGDLVFGSVKKAFLHFQLPLAKHIKFRGQLRDAKQLTFSHGGEEYHFKLVTE